MNNFTNSCPLTDKHLKMLKILKRRKGDCNFICVYLDWLYYRIYKDKNNVIFNLSVSCIIQKCLTHNINYEFMVSLSDNYPPLKEGYETYEEEDWRWIKIELLLGVYFIHS